MKETKPLVYAIVLTWNRCADVLECVASLNESTWRNLEIVVVDNGSKDGTAQTVRQTFPHVQLIENETNLGFAAGNNIGMNFALSQGADYLVVLNDDITVERDCIERLVTQAEMFPNIGLLCPTLVSSLDPSREFVGTEIHWNHGFGVEIERPSAGLPTILETAYAPGGALLARASVLRKIGVFDSEFFIYLEDVDLSLRCKRAGYRVVVVPAARLYHKGTVDNTGYQTPRAAYFFWRNQWYFMRRYASWRDWLPFLKRFLRQIIARARDARARQDQELAVALVNAFWAGTTGTFGASVVPAPIWFHHLLFDYLDFWYWLTGWFYFWDYRKLKRQEKTTP